MTCAFYLCWTPYAIHSILRIAEVWQPPRLSNVIAILFAKSGTVINPILYIFFNNDVSTLSIIIEFVICSYCIILFYLLIWSVNMAYNQLFFSDNPCQQNTYKRKRTIERKIAKLVGKRRLTMKANDAIRLIAPKKC